MRESSPEIEPVPPSTPPVTEAEARKAAARAALAHEAACATLGRMARIGTDIRRRMTPPGGMPAVRGGGSGGRS